MRDVPVTIHSTSHPTRIMLVGLGNLGSQVLDLLLRIPGSHRIRVAGRDPRYLHERTNLAMLVASYLGHDPQVDWVQCDLRNLDQTASAIADFRPDILFSAVSLQSWWVITRLPRPVYEELDRSHVGPWLPMHLTLALRLMQAVRETGLPVRVINASFPDAVNPVLARVGLAPSVGIGNVANPIPALRLSVAEKLGVTPRRIELRLVAQHYVSHRVSRSGNAGDAPFHLSVLLDGADVSDRLEMSTVFDLLPTRFKRVGGEHGQALTAASAITVLEAMANDTGRVVHAPGPNGLPGGYPVRVDARGAEVVLPKGLTLDRAIEINLEGLRFDGIERIDEDGTVYFTAREMEVMERMLGYSCERMSVWESEIHAEELRTRYLSFASRFVWPRQPELVLSSALSGVPGEDQTFA